METTNNQGIRIFITCVLTLVGCTLIGLATGIIISAVWTYVIMGVGAGFLASAVIFFRNYNK